MLVRSEKELFRNGETTEYRDVTLCPKQAANKRQEKKQLSNWHKVEIIQKANDISIAYEQIFEMDRRHDPS